ncbi:MAG TPA: hypothetical protein VE134_09435, partial [Methanomicrobiales archaeon]|nr:hypothetical protein [Methanomicrobiales archaeon]
MSKKSRYSETVVTHWADRRFVTLYDNDSFALVAGASPAQLVFPDCHHLCCHDRFTTPTAELGWLDPCLSRQRAFNR